MVGRLRVRSFLGLAIASTLLIAACGAEELDGDGDLGARDPGTEAWELVPKDRVATECGLDPDLLEAADQALGFRWAVIRYGKLCHEYYPDGDDPPQEVYSATKTLSAIVTGVAAYRTKGLERDGRKTGPLSDEDRVDHWLDDFDFNPDAQVAHVLAMVAHNEDLSYGARDFSYDDTGVVQINRLNDVVRAAIAQDPENLGADIEELTQQFVFQPLGMKSSTWNEGLPDKPWAFGWYTTVRDMARLGLLILNGGVWNAERVVEEEWVQKITHPAFEDASTGYGYLTWLSSRSNHGEDRAQGPSAPCSPAAIWPEYPHGLSEAADCGYDLPYTCDQEYDVGVWTAAGFAGQHIVGHPGLDMVLVAKYAGLDAPSFPTVWNAMRPALIALDPTFQGDEEAFCEAYANNAYAPDLY